MISHSVIPNNEKSIERFSLTGILVSLIFIFGLLSPTINVLLKDLPILKLLVYVFAAIILILLFSICRLTKNGFYLIIVCAILAILTLSPYEVLKNVSFFYFIFIFYIDYEKLFIKISVFIFLINAIFIICQLVGVSTIFYFAQDYSNEAEAAIGEFGLGNVITEQFSYLPQIRPSGIFPSPTYVSNFCIFFWYFILVNRKYSNWFVLLLFGFSIMLLGSTVSILLVILSFFFIKSKKSILFFPLGAVLGSLFYLYFFPLTFIYNFNFEEFVDSFLIRIISNDINQESMLLNNPILFGVILITMLIMPLVIPAGKSLMLLTKGAIVILLPVLIHNAFSSIQFWITASLFLAEFLSNGNFKLARIGWKYEASSPTA